MMRSYLYLYAKECLENSDKIMHVDDLKARIIM